MTAPAVVPARSEDQVVGAILEVAVGGRKKGLRVLTMRESRKWKIELVDVGVGGIGKIDLRGTEDVAPLFDAAADKILDLVVRYDVDGSLGGREWLEANATDAEVYGIFRRCLEVSFPFVRDLRTALAEIRALGLADLLASARSQPESSTSGEPTSGDSASTPSLLTSS